MRNIQTPDFSVMASIILQVAAMINNAPLVLVVSLACAIPWLWSVSKTIGHQKYHPEIFGVLFGLSGFFLWVLSVFITLYNPPYEVNLRVYWQPDTLLIASPSAKGDVLEPITLVLYMDVANRQSVQTRINSFYLRASETGYGPWATLHVTPGGHIYDLIDQHKADEIEFVSKELSHILRTQSLQANEVVSGIVLFSVCNLPKKGHKALLFHLHDSSGNEWETFLEMPHGMRNDAPGTVLTQEELGMRFLGSRDISKLNRKKC